MTTIWMDPADMNATAKDLGAQAQKIQDTMAGTASQCLCDVPPSLAGWLEATLTEITQDALGVAVGYVEQALDTAIRAAEILTDQSLATTVQTDPNIVTIGGTSLSDSSLSELEGIGGYSTTATIGGSTWTNPPTTDWLSSMSTGGGGGLAFSGGLSGSSFAQLMDITESQGDMGMTMLAPMGLTYDHGEYVDGGGDRTDNLVNSYVEPDGTYDITP